MEFTGRWLNLEGQGPKHSPVDFNKNSLIEKIQPIVYRECDVKDKYLPIAASAAWDKCPSRISTCTSKLPWLLYIATMYVF